MVCKKCEAKLTSLATPSTFKDAPGSSTSSSSGRRVNENKLLTSRKKGTSGSNPYQHNCKICKSITAGPKHKYCQGCSYKNGICAMCGVQILDTRNYRQSMK